MGISRALDIGVKGIVANQAKAQVHAANVTNSQVEGYTRKIAEQKSLVSVGLGDGMEIERLARHVDSGLLRNLQKVSGQGAIREVKNDYYTRLQQVFGLLDGKENLAQQITQLSNVFSQSSLNVTSSSARQNILYRANELAQRFRYTTSELQVLRQETDAAIEREIGQIQGVLSRLHSINREIRQLSGSPNASTNDLRDERDRLITQLSGSLNVSTYERSTGDMVVSTGGGQALINLEPITITYQRFGQVVTPTTMYPRSFDAIAVDGVDITPSILSGRLRALLDLRDNILPDAQEQVDQLATLLRDEMNAAHNQGTGIEPPTTLTSTRTFDPATIAAYTPSSWSGKVRVALVDSAGKFVSQCDLDLSATANLGAVAATLNAALGAGFATFTANGELQLNAPAGKGIAFGDIDGQTSAKITVGSKTVGFSHYFGFNDLFVNPSVATGAPASVITSSSKFNPAGTDGPVWQGWTRVAVVDGSGKMINQSDINLAGKTIGDVITALNATFGGGFATLGGDGKITLDPGNPANYVVFGQTPGQPLAEVTVGTLRQSFQNFMGFSNYARSSGYLVGDFSQLGISQAINVNPVLLGNNNRLSLGKLNSTATPTSGNYQDAQGLTVGDGSIADLLANTLIASPVAFDPVHALGKQTTTLAKYAATIVSRQAVEAKDVYDQKRYYDALLNETKINISNTSGVNIDEEIEALGSTRQALAASAEVVKTVSKMMDIMLSVLN